MPKPGKDPQYLAWLRCMPCWACTRRSVMQEAITEAAHVGLSTSRRGLSQKYPDVEAIPLCVRHHREGAVSIHKLGPDAFFRFWRGDRDTVIKLYRRAYADGVGVNDCDVTDILGAGLSVPQTATAGMVGGKEGTD